MCVCFTAYHTPLIRDRGNASSSVLSCAWKHKVSFLAAPVFSSSHLNVDYVLQHNPGRADHASLQFVYASSKKYRHINSAMLENLKIVCRIYLVKKNKIKNNKLSYLNSSRWKTENPLPLVLMINCVWVKILYVTALILLILNARWPPPTPIKFIFFPGTTFFLI